MEFIIMEFIIMEFIIMEFIILKYYKMDRDHVLGYLIAAPLGNL
jgi:hypothetical protein